MIPTTWQQAVDYTFRTRDRWRHGNGATTARINTGHFTRLMGADYPIGSINNQTVTRLCLQLEAEGMADATINRVVSAVSTVMNHLAFDGIIASAPKFRRRREVEHRLTWFTKDEVDAMYANATAANKSELADIVVCGAYTGLRQGELLSLRSGDIDLNDGLIHVGGREGFTTKAANYRSIPIHPHINSIIAARVNSSGSTVCIFGDEWSDRNQLMRAFTRLRKSIGKDDTHVFHSLRHSFGTWCIDAGVNVRVVMELLGHKRIETTLRYAKVSSKVRTDAILAI